MRNKLNESNKLNALTLLYYDWTHTQTVGTVAAAAHVVNDTTEDETARTDVVVVRHRTPIATVTYSSVER